MIPRRSKCACVVAIVILLAIARLGHGETRSKEGQFAVQLAQRLGLAQAPRVEEAVELLTKAGLVPRDGWDPKKPADAELIVRTQVPVYGMLHRLSRSLKVPAPPTLGLQVLQRPYGPQTIFFSEAEVRAGEATQGAFAVKLAQRLKLSAGLSEKQAVERFSKIGLIPEEGWRPAAKATDLFVVRVQIAMLEMLKDVASELEIPLPPTVHVRVVLEE